MFVIKDGETTRCVIERLVKKTEGYSGSELARISGLDKGIISRMRRGKFLNPALSTVVALASVPPLGKRKESKGDC